MAEDFNAIAATWLPVKVQSRRDGFTLVELLVVIAIIAILAALLLPVLASTKLKATEAACLSNQRQLILAFAMYSSQNDDRIVGFGSMDGYINYAGNPGPWNAAGLNSDQAVAILTKTLSAANVDPLYRYANNIQVIHCPGDTRYKMKNPGPNTGWAFDSYSKSQNIAGEGYSSFWGAGGTYTTVASVAAPSLTFAIREDVDPRGYNEGTWVLTWRPTRALFGHPQSFDWTDPIPMYHGNVSTAAFVDGHAEAYAWGDSAIINYGKAAAAGTPGFNFTPPGGSPPKDTPDYEYIYQGYRFPGWKQ